jgi:hypothetical protein
MASLSFQLVTGVTKGKRSELLSFMPDGPLNALNTTGCQLCAAWICPPTLLSGPSCGIVLSRCTKYCPDLSFTADTGDSVAGAERLPHTSAHPEDQISPDSRSAKCDLAPSMKLKHQDCARVAQVTITGHRAGRITDRSE